MMKFVFVLCLLTLYACDSSEDENGIQQGFAPGNIIGKTLTLTKNNGNVYLSVEHLNESAPDVNNATIDYLQYPPLYSYETTGYNEAFYYLDITKVTYIPYLQKSYYSNFSFSINLTFTAESKGFYRGIETNAEGKDKNIGGTFTLN